MVFRRRRKGRGKKPLVKRVNKISRQMSSLVTHAVEVTSDSTFAQYQTTFAGVANTTAMNVAAAAFLNTSLGASVSPQGRPGNQIYFDSFDIGIRVAPFTAQPAFAGAISFRIIVVHIKHMPQDGAGVYRHPTIRELLTTAATTVNSDLYAPVAVECLVAGKQANFHIVKDIRFGWLVSGGGNDNSEVVHRRIKIKVPKGTKTTYDGDNNTIVDMAENHYITYVMACPTIAVAANSPDITFNQVARFHY